VFLAVFAEKFSNFLAFWAQIIAIKAEKVIKILLFFKKAAIFWPDFGENRKKRKVMFCSGYLH
jgi:hypothetical protein